MIEIRWRDIKDYLLGALQTVTGKHSLALLLLAALFYPAILIFIHSPATSPVDEWVYIDYTDKVLTQGYLHSGETVGAFTANIMACDGVFTGGKFGQCGAGLSNLDDLPYGGVNAASAYTPLYFGITSLAANPLTIIGFDKIEAWRLTGALWLCVAMYFYYLLLRDWGVRKDVILYSGLLIVSSPFVWWANSFVSTDAPTLFFGTVVLYLTNREIQHPKRFRYNLTLLILSSTTAVLLKVTNLVSLLLAAIFAVITVLHESGTRNVLKRVIWSNAGHSLLALLGSGFISIVGLAAWQKFLFYTKVQSPEIDQGISADLDLPELARQVFSFIPNAATATPFAGHGFDFLWAPLNLVIIGSVLGLVLEKGTNAIGRKIGTASLVAGLAGGPILAIAVQLATKNYFSLPARYGAALIPSFAAAVAIFPNTRWGHRITFIVAAQGAIVGILLALHFS